MNRSTPGLPVHHQLLKFTQTHAHQVSDTIQPSHPLSSPSPPAPNPSQHQGLFHWVNSLHQVAKVLEFQLQSFLPCLGRASLPQVRTIPTLRVQNGNNVNFTEKETETQKNIISSTSHFLGSRHYKKDFTRVISLNPQISLCPPNHPQTW